MGKKGEKGGAPQRGKGAPRRKETEENEGRKGSAPCKGRSAAKVEEELRKRAEWYCRPTVPQDAELWELG